jgi:hypothetical protein
MWSSPPPTANWDMWAVKTLTAAVNAGANTIRITATTANGNANLDYLDYLDFTVQSSSPVDCQAEDATISPGPGGQVQIESG